MLIISNLSKSFGPRTLFEEASLQVQRGERIGVVGANGAGKTTLFSLILGQDEADSGQIELQRDSVLGYLPQESAPVGDETVLHLAAGVTPALIEVYRDLRAHPDPNDEKHQAAQARWAELNAFHTEAEAKKILGGLAFKEADLDRPAHTLSGGWIMRAHLARLLVQQPDLLMLDEPTNHLDLESLGWFQNYLRQYPGAIVVISHDREFLNIICGAIVEIEHRRLQRYTGNYSEYLVQKEARRLQQWAAYNNQQKEIAHLQSFVDRFRAQATKASQAQSRLKMLDRMVRIEAPEEPSAGLKFKFPLPQRGGHTVIELKGVRQAYGDHVVYKQLDLKLERGERIVLVGPNGAGKSTLLKILAGVVPIQAGEILPGLNLQKGYFSQQRADNLNLERTVWQEATTGDHKLGEQEIRNLLGTFLIRGDDIHKPVKVLSGGEKSRLSLVRMLLQPPNLLLLDEPTTHLDMPSIDALIQAMESYTGTVVFVSHDVHFIRAIAKTVIHVDAGKLTRYAGGYDYYLEKSQAGTARQGLVASGFSDRRPDGGNNAIPDRNAGLTGKEKRRQAAQKREAMKELEKKVIACEEKVLHLEERQQQQIEEIEKLTEQGDSQGLKKAHHQLAKIVTELQTANQAWEKAVEEYS
jgi:ATP-binding cassette subfamily F protein 3